MLPEFKDRCDINNPEPGIYTDLSKFEYFALNAVSRSTLVTFDENPAYLRRPNEWTDSKVLGEQYHAMILQPHVFSVRYEEGTRDRRTKEDKAFYKEQVERLGGEEYVYRPQQKEVLDAMRAALDEPENLGFRKMLINNDPSELTLVWIDESTGLLCKARVDKFLLEDRWLLDLKTAADAKKHAMRRAIVGTEWPSKMYHGYDMQAAFYLQGAIELGLRPEGFVIVAQEKTFPYIVESYQISQGVIDTAAYRINSIMVRYAQWLGSKPETKVPQTIDWEDGEIGF